MNNTLSDTLLLELSEFVSRKMGLCFPRERWGDLERGIASVSRKLGFGATEASIKSLISSQLTKAQIETLASELTVGETYFLRDRRGLEVVEGGILPELIQIRRGTDQRLRIWSAGCATGEEPYSIAMMVSNLIPDARDWNVTILATDINPRFLQKAVNGIYNDWSFRDCPAWVKERYFKKTNEGRFEILPSLRKMVTFSYLNLAEDAFPSLMNNTNAMDFVFCRNVLMYFAPEPAKRVVENLHRSLVDGGWLVLSPTDTSNIHSSEFKTVYFPGVILYRKSAAREVPGPYRRDLEAEAIDLGRLEQAPEEQVQAIPFFQPETEELPSLPSAHEEIRREDLVQPQPSLYLEALAMFGEGSYAEAGEKLTLLLSRDEQNASAMALLARAYANQGKLAEALTWIERAITAEKLNPSLQYLRSTILQERGELHEAAASLKRALYLDQKFVLAHYALGTLSQKHGKLKESEKHYRNALALLGEHRHEEILLESEGMTAGRLIEIVRSALSLEMPV